MELKSHKVRQNDNKLRFKEIYKHHLDLVFCKEDGSPLPKSTLFNAFERILKCANIPYVSIHCLRDTHAVLLLEAGATMKYIQERLRHANIETTFNTYGHISKKIETKSIEDYDAYMSTFE